MVHFRKHPEIPEVALTISFSTFARLTVLIAVTLSLWSAVHKASHALLLIFTAFFLALALNGPVYWLGRQLPGKRRGSRSLATTLSFIIVIVLLGGFIASIAPPLVKQTENLVNAAPRLVREIHDQNNPVGNFIRHYHLESQVNGVANQLSERLKNIGGTAFSTVQKIGSSFFSLLTVLVLTFMMLVEGPRWLTFAREVVPDHHHSLYDRLTRDMYKVIQGYVNGQVLLAALASVLIMPAVLLLHISYPAAIMVIIFICGLIPLVGHTIGAAIVTLVALFHSTTAAIIILAYYLFYMQIEAYIVQPRIQANSTNMSPLLVFASVIIGVSFGGLFGGLVAIPVAGCLRIAILEFLRSQNIIDTPQFKAVTTKGTK
ncbi:MAG TPA: AI-2E family transporter [Candidatus Saccharimonadales bacterium]|jgi:predicted PurR-regulated permease PerM|nr:AI-2E family transporter [Candidatus Saccharimonadales bacterium]